MIIKNLSTVFMVAIICLATNIASAQNVGINDDGSTPEASAILHLKSAVKGLLIPEVNIIELDSSTHPVDNPAEGLLVYNTNTTTGKGFHYWDGTAWLPLQKGTDIGAFNNAAGVVINTGDDATDDFVFGSPQLDDDGIADHNRRFFFDKSKGAFRAGTDFLNKWDEANVGDYSTALGSNTVASGRTSTAMGELTNASGSYSTAMGVLTTASGSQSTTMGASTTASGTSSTAMGSSTTASGGSSTTMGSRTTASGLYSIAMGRWTTANSYISTALGRFNVGGGSSTDWVETDPLFEIGNGTSTSAKSNALTIYKNGKLEINEAYTLPNIDGASGEVLRTDGAGAISWQPELGTFTKTGTVVHNGGDDATDDFVFGSPQLDDDGSAAHNRRFFFDKSKGAFRAGYVSGNRWDDVNVGPYSTAMGYQTTASGGGSAAMGYQTTASGTYSTAMGYQTTASGDRSTAMGNSTTASGPFSTAMGNNTNASGNYSTAMGSNTTANGYISTAMGNNTTANYNSTALGRYNVGGGSNYSWVEIDPLFEIGNGTSTTTSNALTVLKNGNVGIGTTNPTTNLHITGGTDAELTGGGYLIIGDKTGDNLVIDNNEIMARNNGVSDNLYLQKDSDGKVGIGRIPTANRLEVNGNASKTSAGSWLANSDARLKKNIQPLQSEATLQKMLALRGVTYEWNDTKTGYDRPLGIQYGFTAQNVQAIFPELVSEDNLGYLQTAYGTYDAMYIEALRALNDKIEALEKENASLQEQVGDIITMKAELEQIKILLKGNQEQ